MLYRGSTRRRPLFKELCSCTITLIDCQFWTASTKMIRKILLGNIQKKISSKTTGAAPNLSNCSGEKYLG